MNQSLEFHKILKDITEKAMTIEDIFNDNSINETVKNTVIINILNKYPSTILDIIKHFNMKNIIKDITNIDTLFITYTYFLETNNENLKDVHEQIQKITFLSNQTMDYLYYESVFIYAINENLNFKELSKLINYDKHSQFAVQIKFHTKTVDTIMKFETHNSKEEYINFNISNLDLTVENICDFYFLKEVSSSSMHFETINIKKTIKMLNLNSMTFDELKEIFNRSGSSKLFQINKLIISKNGFDKNNKPKLNLSLKNPPNSSQKLDFSLNKNLTLDNKIELLEISLKNNIHRYDIDYFDVPMFQILKEIKCMEKIKDCKNILSFCNLIYIQEFNEYHNNYFSSGNSYLNPGLIILIDKIKDDSFINNLFKEFTNTKKHKDLSNIFYISEHNFDDEMFLKVFKNYFIPETFIAIAKLRNKSYFYEMYKGYERLFSNERILKIILNTYIHDKNVNKVIEFNSLFSLLKEEINDFLSENIDEVRKLGKINKYYIEFKKRKLIDDEEFVKYFLIDFKYDNYNNIKLLDKPKKLIDQLKPIDQFKLRLFLYKNNLKEKLENHYLWTKLGDEINFEIIDQSIEINKELEIFYDDKEIFNILNTNKFEIFIDKNVIKYLVVDENLEFLTDLVEENKSIELLNEIFEIANFLDIKIGDNIKKEFYHMFITDIEEVFTL